MATMLDGRKIVLFCMKIYGIHFLQKANGIVPANQHGCHANTLFVVSKISEYSQVSELLVKVLLPYSFSLNFHCLSFSLCLN